MSLSLDMLRLVDARIRALMPSVTKSGTVTEVVGNTAYVAFDGSSNPMPIKYVAGLNLGPDARVTVTLHGGDWVVTGSFLRTPTVLTPTLLNGWSNYGSGYAPAAYFRDPGGRVHCEGMITGGTVTSGTNLFQLGVGFRPLERLTFTVITVAGQARVDVESDGFVKAVTGVQAGFLSLSGIDFLARQ